MSWPRAARLAVGWTIAALATAICVLCFAPAGAASTATAEVIAILAILGAPVVAGLIHRSLKVPGLVLGCFVVIGAVVLIVVLANRGRWDHDREYQRRRGSGSHDLRRIGGGLRLEAFSRPSSQPFSSS